MAREFPETAHLSTDKKKYGDNYDHVFNRSKCQCDECLKESNQETDLPEEQRP